MVGPNLTIPHFEENVMGNVWGRVSKPNLLTVRRHLAFPPKDYYVSTIAHRITKSPKIIMASIPLPSRMRFASSWNVLDKLLDRHNRLIANCPGGVAGWPLDDAHGLRLANLGLAANLAR